MNERRKRHARHTLRLCDHIEVRRGVPERKYTLVFCVRCGKLWAEPHRSTHFTGGQGVRVYPIPKEDRFKTRSLSTLDQMFPSLNEEFEKLLMSEECQKALRRASPEKYYACQRCGKKTNELWICHSCELEVCEVCWDPEKKECKNCSRLGNK